MPTLAERLRFLQGARSKREWARVLGVSEASVRRYLAGETTPTADVLVRICDDSGASPEWLLFGRERDSHAAELVELADVDPRAAAAEATLRRVWRYGSDDQRAAVEAVLRAMDPGEKKGGCAEDHADEGMAGPGAA